jgi:drug/metabolite transporter (DMT)-like permease
MRLTMDPLVVVAILGASLLHASWHALVKASGDRVVALAGMNLVSGCVAAALLPLGTLLPLPVFGIIAISVVLHVGYKLALASLYERADLGKAYPLARGLTPIMAALIGYIALGEIPGTQAATGIALICAGLVLLAFEGPGGRIALPSIAAAVVAGFAVAAYSVLDAYGVRLAGDWLSFTLWLVILDSGTFVAYAIATRRGRVLQAWKDAWGKTIISGALGIVSFGVFMWALGRAPVGQVSALRETSVLFAALIGALILGEHATWKRYAAAAAVTVGVGVIALAA